MRACSQCGAVTNGNERFCVNCRANLPLLTRKEYAIEQRRFNEKVFGRGTRSIDSVEGLLNKYAQEGWRLHTMMTAPTKDEKTQLTTMVFERDVLAP